METKPKINFSKTADKIVDDQRARLERAPAYHYKNEKIASSILDMMLEKTLMYGGNSNDVPFDEKVLRLYYEGVGRKANRLPQIIKRAIAGDLQAKKELIDTLIDVAGYSILGLNAIAEEIQLEFDYE